MVLAEGLARYEAMVTEPVTRVETSWAGLQHLRAGPVRWCWGPNPAVAGFFWCGGSGRLRLPDGARRLGLPCRTDHGRRAADASTDILRALLPARFR